MKSWGGKNYDTDFHELLGDGTVSADKDWAASEGWTAENEPWRSSPGWHAQPLSAEQEAGIQQTNPQGWAARQAWRAANPTNAIGGPSGGGAWGSPGASTPGAPPMSFDWGGWNVGQGAGGDLNWALGNEREPFTMEPSAPSVPPGGGYTAPVVGPAGPLSSFSQAMQDALLRELGPATVDQNSPAYRGQVDAFNRNSQRAAERRRASEAQRAYAGGTLSSGGFDARVGQIAEDQGRDEADFEAGLQASELAAARDRQGRAQALGAGLLSQEQQQGLQARLANQGSQLQTNALNTTRDLGQRSLGLQDKFGTNADILRRNALMLQQQLGLGDLDLRRLGLTNQNSQFYDSLGQQLGLSTAAMNQQALLALLGG